MKGWQVFLLCGVLGGSFTVLLLKVAPSKMLFETPLFVFVVPAIVGTGMPDGGTEVGALFRFFASAFLFYGFGALVIRWLVSRFRRAIPKQPKEPAP